jgi:G2/mitotic-specific cyclin-B2
LEQIENIDSKDDLNPLLMSEYVNEIYVYLNKLEVEFPVDKDHLDGQAEITPKMRSVLVDWINEVHYQFRLEIETYHMTVSIIDRYLQVSIDEKQHKLQIF